MTHGKIVAMVGLSLLTAAACGGEQEGERRPMGQQPSADMQGEMPEDHPDISGMEGGTAGGTAQRALPPEVTVHLDSGNVAYRAGEYEEARRHFLAAVSEDSTASAGWFGVYMAERALGDDAAADSALQRAGGLGEASGMHPSPGADADSGEMPHPPMDATTGTTGG